jgi:hypothetical protein
MAKPRQALSNITNIGAAFGAPVKEAPMLRQIPDHALEAAPMPQGAEVHEEDTVGEGTGVSIPPYIVPATEFVENIDLEDMENPYTCSVYVNDVYRYLEFLQVSSIIPSLSLLGLPSPVMSIFYV